MTPFLRPPQPENLLAHTSLLSEEQTQGAAAAFNAWLAQVEPLLATPLASSAMHRVYFFTGVEALAAGRAQTKLTSEIMASLPADTGARGKMLNDNKL